MLGAFQGIVGFVELTLVNGSEFAMDRDHGVAEALESLPPTDSLSDQQSPVPPSSPLPSA